MSAPTQVSGLDYTSPPFTLSRIKSISTAYTIQPNDNGYIINCTANTFTVSLTAAATSGRGFNCWVWNNSTTSTDVITIDPNAEETIDGVATLLLYRGEGLQIICDGTNWQTGNKKTMRGYAENFSPTYSAGRPRAVGLNSQVLGGSYASGTEAFAAAIGTNSASYGATGTYSIAIGRLARASNNAAIAIGAGGGAFASGPGAVAIGGTTSLNDGSAAASGTGAFACGDSTIASGTASVAIGYAVQASGYGSVAMGIDAVAAIRGKYAYAATGFSSFRGGQCQYGMVILARQTTDATATVLTVDNTAPGADDQVILPNNSAYAFTGTVVARRQAAGGTESAAWKIEGLIRREGTAASTTLVASTVTAISNAPGWTLALSADTTNGGLAVTATGAAATNIRWVAIVQTSEVTYA